MLRSQSNNRVSFTDNLPDLKQYKRSKKEVGSFEEIDMLLENFDWDIEVNADVLWVVFERQDVDDVLPLLVYVGPRDNHPEKDGGDRE